MVPRFIRLILPVSRGAERGSTAVEFALVAFPMFFLIGCILEVGLTSLVQFQLQNSVQAGARLVRIGAVTNHVTSAITVDRTAMIAQICSTIRFLPNCAANLKLEVLSAGSFANLNFTGPNAVGSLATPTYNPGGSMAMGSMVATYDWRFYFPFVGEMFGNVAGQPNIRRLSGVAIFRNEQF